MMRGIANQMRLQAQMQAGGRVVTKLALVTSYDPSTYSAKVKLQPEDTLTGWLPIGAVMVGNGWGIYAPPSAGDQVKVSFIDGDIESGVVTCALYNDQDRPLSAPSGEIWLVSRGGAKIQLLTANALNIEATTITSSGAWTHTGDFTASGTVTGQTDVVGATKSLKNHTHGGVQSGTSQTLKPT